MQYGKVLSVLGEVGKSITELLDGQNESHEKQEEQENKFTGQKFNNYVLDILKKEDFLQGIKTAGLEADGKMSIVSNKAFFALKTNQQFKKGEQRLTLAEIDAYISYQIDQDGRIDVFERQEDIIRLMKHKTVRPRLSVITNNYGTVKEYTDSNLNLKDLLKLGSGYLAKGNARMNKVDVPTAGSFTLSGDFPYQLETIDWKKNTLKLRSKLV